MSGVGAETEEMKKTEYTSLVPAVDQASRILICLAKTPSFKMNLTDICKNVGIHKSKGYAILNTLLNFKFVERDDEGKTYTLGPGLISLSRRVLDNLEYRDMAGPFLERLAQQTGSTATFGIVNGRNFIIIAKREGDRHAFLTIRVGYQLSITHGAVGKAIIACVPGDEREEVLSQEKLLFHGDPSKLDRNRLETEFEECRKAGYALDLGEMFAGLNAVAAPVFDHAGKPTGALLVTGSFSKSLAHEYGVRVAECAREFSTTLGADIEEIFKRPAKEDLKDEALSQRTQGFGLR
ncbi:MAG: IclR family transcriptional regulator [Syntrophobacterales bacterium]|jgi:DNA-binding IclR family transcriptional regulator|nr:IclR family transcriptional regulator [Syntrophobacterales bacterium]